MNPDTSKSSMTVNSLMQWGVAISIAVPIILFALLAFISLNASSNTLLYVDTAFAFITLIVVFTVSQWVQRKVRERLASIADVCRDFSSGDRSARAVVSGDDDVAMVAMSINSLFDGYTASNAAMGVGGNDAAALQAQIEKLLQEVSAVGDGDLRIQAEVTPDTLGVLADSFNYMIEELAKVVGRVQTTAVQVTNATRRILDRSAELAQASETQVKQIAQTTEAVEALAVFIQTVARNAQSSVEAAQEALRNAANGQQAVRQTIEGMMLIRENVQETAKKIKRLGERSNEIGEIVRIIEDIADQTNLLALNAAIQSAMAGEHGRGFAVVADEIRLLAERSTESTKRIATLVKSIQGDTYEAVVAMEDSTQEVVKGSQLADDAGRSLNSIYTAVERQAQMIESIAHAANEQTSVSEAVAIAMSRISEITRQTDAGTQEAAVSVSYLAELSEQLRASVSTFRLPERANESFGSFSNATSVTELSENQGNQMYRLSPSLGAMGAPAEPDWGQGFPANFPPLSDFSNPGSLLPVSSRAGAGQFSLGSQQDFASQAGLGGLSGFENQNLDPMQANFPNVPSFANQANLDNQQFFGNQQGFGDMNGFDDVQGMNTGLAGLQFGAMSNSLSNPGQSPYPQSGPGQSSYPLSSPAPLSYPQSGFGQSSYPQSGPGQPSYPQPNADQSLQGLNSGFGSPPVQQGGQPMGSRPRWQPGSQKDPNQ
ncbi:MAG TPA: methyl-accepting chemotaxis protein [Ktedonobacteraceae bacterium]|nr:methyl-accepting chemotaxis protein [Ktedonobacteraceae bacterium]